MKGLLSILSWSLLSSYDQCTELLLVKSGMREAGRRERQQQQPPPWIRQLTKKVGKFDHMATPNENAQLDQVTKLDHLNGFRSFFNKKYAINILIFDAIRRKNRS